MVKPPLNALVLHFASCMGLTSLDGNGLHPLGIAGIVLIIVGFFFLLLFLLAFLIGKRSVDHKESKLKKDQLFIEAQQRHKLQK